MVSILRVFPNQLVLNSLKLTFRRHISKIEKPRNQWHEKLCNKVRRIASFDSIKNQINEITTPNVSDESHCDLIYKLILTAQQDEEIDFLVQFLEKINGENVQDNMQLKKIRYRLINHLFFLNKTDKTLELLSKKALNPLVLSLVDVLSELIKLNKHDDAIKVYEMSSEEFKNSVLALSIFTKSLLIVNTNESFEKMNKIMKNNSMFIYKLGTNTVLNVVLLSINQKQFEFAKNFLNSLKATNKSDIILQNLESIVLCHLGKLDESLALMEEILTNDDCFMYDLKRKFFKLTLDTFRNTSQASPRADELTAKFEDLCSKITDLKQLNGVDLYNLATEFKPLKKTPEKITPSANNEISKSAPNQQKLLVVGKKIEKTTSTPPKNEVELFDKISKAFNEKRFFLVKKLFEKNFLNLETSKQISITEPYLSLYANSLLKLHAENKLKIQQLIQLPLTNTNLEFDNASKSYLLSLYESWILNQGQHNSKADKQNDLVVEVMEKNVKLLSDEKSDRSINNENNPRKISNQLSQQKSAFNVGKEQCEKYFKKEQYQKCLDTFDALLKSSNPEKKLDKLLIRILTRSLYKTNKRVDEIKSFLNLIDSSGSMLNYLSIIDIFLLYLNHNEPMLALEFLSAADPTESLSKKNPSIYTNLLISGFCLMNRFDIAMEQVEKLFEHEVGNESGNSYSGRIFPFTIKCLRIAAFKADQYQLAKTQTIVGLLDDSKIDENNTPGFNAANFNNWYDRMLKENRISNVDLAELPYINFLSN